MDFSPGFWEFVERESRKTMLKSNDMVLEELKDYGDELSRWVKERQTIFDISSDVEEIQINFAEIADYVNEHPVYKASEKQRFLQKADPWLIATAKYLEAVIVTHEARVPDESKMVKIPNVAAVFDVHTIDTFELMRRLGGRLELG